MIKDLKKGIDLDITIYPNPVNRKLFIDLNKENTQLKIFNILGEKIHEEKVKTIATSVDVCSWDKGLYTVVLDIANDIKTYRIEVN